MTSRMNEPDPEHADERRFPGAAPPGRTTGIPHLPQTEQLALGQDPQTAHRMEVVLSAANRAAVHALPPASALLIVHRGPQAGARFLLDAERTTAGRHPRCDIFLDDVTVSRQHAVFLRQDSGFVVEDQASLNGTYVNGDRVDSARLGPGDEIWIGKFRMTFHPSPRAGHPGPRAGQD